MFDAQLLIGTDAGTAVYSPWFSRQGDNGNFTAEVVAISGATLAISIFHKNSDEVGDGASAGSFTNFTTATRDEKELTGLKEMVRYKYTVTAEGDWVMFRMLAPVWFDTVKA